MLHWNWCWMEAGQTQPKCLESPGSIQHSPSMHCGSQTVNTNRSCLLCSPLPLVSGRCCAYSLQVQQVWLWLKEELQVNAYNSPCWYDAGTAAAQKPEYKMAVHQLQLYLSKSEYHQIVHLFQKLKSEMKLMSYEFIIYRVIYFKKNFFWFIWWLCVTATETQN